MSPVTVMAVHRPQCDEPLAGWVEPKSSWNTQCLVLLWHTIAIHSMLFVDG